MMSYTAISEAVGRLIKKYDERDVYRLCELLKIRIEYRDFGTDDDAIKGFYFQHSRCKRIYVNSRLDEITTRLIIAHEIGHSVLHKSSGAMTFQENQLFGSVSITEKEANIFAAELLLEDYEIEEALDSDEMDFFTMAQDFNVPLKFSNTNSMRWTGGAMICRTLTLTQHRNL